MNSFLIIFASTIVAVAALNDLRFQKIPNLLTYPAVVVAIAYHGVTNGLDGVIFGLEGLGLGMGILLLPYIMGGMGAGDVKLLGAVGSILGPRSVFAAFLFTALIGGLYALGLILAKRQLLMPCLPRSLSMVKRPTAQVAFDRGTENQQGPGLCYGVAIALGTLLSIGFELMGQRLPI